MASEIRTILDQFEAVYVKAAWYGKPAIALFGEVDESTVYQRPGNNSHSLIDLLYHMVTWQDFTLRRLKKIQEDNPADIEKLDWREIEPAVHTWKNGLEEFDKSFRGIRDFLQTAPDSLLEEKVDYRDYNFRELLNGIVQHNIYHLGQVAYVQKLLKQGD
jgi:uncharacterized damage-inducible protein DinB